jgi:hypothetical protein
MRPILRKMEKRQPLNEGEYALLMQYAENLRVSSPESFNLFYSLYAVLLYQDYKTYVPRFTYEKDDLYDFIINNPQIGSLARNNRIAAEVFPWHLREYLQYTFPDGVELTAVQPLLDLAGAEMVLPRPRQKEAVIKYEASNPFKEPGLKSHFERIARYSFVSRLQSYRYLSNNKAAADKIYVVADDTLGGIFTNKEKSIYYYISLTEKDRGKAQHACQVLNLALYG